MKRFIANSWINFLILKNKFKTRSEFKPDKVNDVLIIELSRMGDVVSMIKAARCLMENFPASKFNYLIDQKYKNLLKGIFEYCNIDISRITFYESEATDTISGLDSTKKMLSGYKFDLICSMSPSFRNAYLTLSLNSPFKIGFFRSKSVYTPFLKHNRVETIGIKNFTRQTFNNENIEDRGFKICDCLGLKFRETDKIKSQNQINLKPNFEKPFIIIHPFAGWKYRIWKHSNYINLIKKILTDYDIQIFLIGSKEEKKQAEEIYKTVNNRNIKLIFEENAESMLDFFPHAELFIGNDSGPLHLAAFFDIPVIGIYGPAPPSLTAPKKNNNYYFYKKVDCSPCEQIKCIRSENTCMDQITVEEVFAKINEVLNQKTYKNQLSG